MVKRNSSLQRTHFHCSRVQWRWALHHFRRRLALHMVILGLCAAAWAMETNVMKLQMNSSCADVASRGGLELSSECCNRGQMILHASALGGPVLWACVPLHGWAVVAPRCFYFTIKALTVDRGSSSCGLLEMWHPMTVSESHRALQ